MTLYSGVKLRKFQCIGMRLQTKLGTVRRASVDFCRLVALVFDIFNFPNPVNIPIALTDELAPSHLELLGRRSATLFVC